MEDKLQVLATINLPGLPLGREAFIDPTDPYMADCLARGYLQRLPRDGAERSDEETEVEDETRQQVTPQSPDEPADTPAA